MQNPSRRHFLSGSVVTIAALGGCVSDQNVDDSPNSEPKPATIEAEEDVPDGLAAALAAVPAESAVDVEYRSIALSQPDDADASEDFGPQLVGVTDSIDGVDPENVDRILLVRSSDYENTFGVATGSFDSPEPGTEIDAGDEWRIAEGETLAFASTDDLIAFASATADEPPVDRVRTAADAARGDVDAIVESDDRLPETFARLSDSTFVTYLPTVEGPIFPAIGQDRLAAVAAGFEAYPSQQTGTVENAYLLYPADGASIDDDELD
ncbi:MAG TPA: hypothetical protein VKM69_01095, partial [Natronoarchaeum rubrum]|nr:hypothetical protein [Natronoarchaeum rubrum]